MEEQAAVEKLEAIQAALTAWMDAQRKGAPRLELIEAEKRLREVMNRAAR